MKNIDEYIKKITTHENIDYDLLDNIILDHIDIHYRFNYRLITEDKIYEGDGAFPEQHKLVKLILDEIESDNISNKLKDTYVFHLDYDFIKDLHIYIKSNKEKSINGSYVIDNEKYEDYNNIRWDKENNQFRFAEIFIYNYEKDPNGLEEILYHETKHLWDDYINISKKDYFLTDKVKKSLDNKFRNENIDETIKDIIYYSEDYEISAYITEINGILGNKKFITIEDAFNEICKSSVYQNYKFVYYALNTSIYKNELLKHISNKEYKRIKKNINNAWKKIINHTYIICCNHLSENKLSPSSSFHKI